MKFTWPHTGAGILALPRLTFEVVPPPPHRWRITPVCVSHTDTRAKNAKKKIIKRKTPLTDLRTAEHSSDLCVSLRRPRARLAGSERVMSVVVHVREAEGINPAAAQSAAHSVQ